MLPQCIAERLITLQTVPQSAALDIINTMDECMAQGVDIQPRILQTLLLLITNFATIHGQLLGHLPIIQLDSCIASLYRYPHLHL